MSNYRDKEIFELINKYETIVIFGHVYPDGDCYGSQIGLKHALQTTFQNKKVLVTGTGLPMLFSLMEKMDEVSDEELKNALAIIVDTNIENRVEDCRITLAKEVCLIDHHIPNKDRKTENVYIDTRRSSCAEVICDLIRKHDLKLDDIGARGLFLGMMTDSGRLMYEGTSKNTYEHLSKIMEYDVPFKSIFAAIYAQNLEDIRLKGFILSHFKTNGKNIIYIVFQKDDLENLSIDMSGANSMVNILANIDSFNVWISVAHDGGEFARIEFRSNLINVADIAAKFGGGGHKFASGCSVEHYDEHILEEIISELQKEIDDEKQMG